MQERRLLGRSQITLTDTTDSRTISLYLQADNSKQVIYNPNNETYTPDYSEDPLTLTPLMYISDTDMEQALVNNIDKAKSITYHYKINSKGDWVTVTGSEQGLVREGNDLRVVSNLLNNSETVLIRVEVLYEDSNGVDIVSLAEVELIKVALGLDGTDGLQPVTPIIQAPHGKAIYNRDGYVILELTLLRGTEEVTPDWIRWYQINPMSLGDEYSSSGWSFLNETNKELILDEGRIHDSNTILVVAEYEGRIYRVTQQVEDITDPVDVEVIGPTVFKNGRGSVDLFAKIYKNGVEIDKRGKDYGYSWYGYDNFGNLVDGFHKFGKQVTFTRDEVDNIVNISLMASENIATVDKLIPNGTGVSKKDSQFTINPVNRTNGVRISSELFDKGITYKLEFTLEELTGGISGLGGSTTGFEPLKVRVNGKFYPVTSWELGTIDLSDEGLDEHFIELWLTSQEGTELLIQPGLGSVVQGTEVRLTDIGVMRGAQEPSEELTNTWEPFKDTTWLDNSDKSWLELL